ncbi:hypothetical protein GCM10023321_37140 [Pseudonocardia eucalypti]|uniref:DNA-binding response OmpR family regulator n=1 Tax=Pseudonocardia eucalypti TaxID=648755 RepID=A0ABP9Q7F5_9PSEU|nr:DNA-binding response OmpR family regulator [Pseudonocardia eucalypti]
MQVLFLGHRSPGVVALARALPRWSVRPVLDDTPGSVHQRLVGADAAVVALPPDVGRTPDLSRGADGIALCRAIRARSNVSVILLVSGPEVGERILRMRAGADDYLCEPFHPIDLLARIKVVRRLRDRLLEPAGVVRVDDVTIDLDVRSVTVADRLIELTRKEFDILKLLAEEGGGVCSRDKLLDHIWGEYRLGAGECLNVHMSTLRGKLGRPWLIQTVRGVGYRLAMGRVPSMVTGLAS